MQAIKAIVIGMGLVIFVLAGIVIWRMYQLAGGGATASSPEVVAPRALGLPNGAEIIDSDLSGSRILLRVKLGNGAVQLLVYDFERQLVLSKIDLAEEP